MYDTFSRHLTMLSLVPVLPRKCTAGELREKLVAQGFDVHIRSVERDLQKLSHFGLTDDGAKPAGWSWVSRDRVPTLPPMSTENALVLELVRRHLGAMLPPRMLRQMERPFEEARRTLNLLGDAPLKRWTERVAVLPDGPPLATPEVAAGVLEAVGEALLRDRRLDVQYRALDRPRGRRYTLHPLGLVYRDGVFYLVATVNDYDDIRHFALQRMREARVLDETAGRPADFVLAEHLDGKRAFQWPHGETVRLELKVERWLAIHLEERCLAGDQVITPLRGDPERSRVTATVEATEQLYWWLRSLGTSVEVVKPARLRQRLADEVRQLAEVYR
ncbi:MAG: WYL domain-containing protein [Xanthomonadales bacterium]|nr:WYL domain-containing protein [Xanthomonadales bacterium]